MQEKHTREKLLDHLKASVAIQEDLKVILTKLRDVEKKIKLTSKRKERLLHPGAL